MTTAAEIRIQVTTNAGAAAKEIGKLDGTVSKGTKSLGAMAKSLLGPLGIAVGATAAAKAVIDFSKASIQAASDAEETANKFNVTFRDIRGAADATAENLAENFGLSRQAAQSLLADTGDLLSGFGFTQDAALDLATQVNELAVDLASFTNYSGGAEGASQALTKALLGERESIKSLGIAITEADINRLAEEKGITGELDRQTKAMLTLELAISQSQNAIGDFERSQESFANQQRIANAAVEDLKVSLGEALLPAATTLTGAFADLVRGLDDFVTSTNEARKEADALARAERGIAEDSALTADRIANIEASIRTAFQAGDAETFARAVGNIAESYGATDDEIISILENIQLYNDLQKEIRDATIATLDAERISLSIEQDISGLRQQRLDAIREEQAIVEERQRLAEAERMAQEERIALIVAQRNVIEEGFNEEIRLINLRNELGLLKQEEYNDAIIAANESLIDQLLDLGYDGVGSQVGDQLIQGAIDTIGELTPDLENAALAAFEAVNDAAEASWLDRLQKLDAALDEQRKMEEAAAQASIDLDAARLDAAVDLFSSIGDLLAQNADDERKAFNIKKAFSLVETTINTAKAVMAFLGQGNPVLAGFAAAQGVVQAAIIASAQPPAAQFGGSFTVPPGNQADSGLVRVNQGERVDVTPVRQSSGGSGGGTAAVYIDGQKVGKMVFDMANSGSIGKLDARLIRA